MNLPSENIFYLCLIWNTLGADHQWFGGGSSKSGKTRKKKKAQLNNVEDKKAQLNNLEEKNSTQQSGRKKIIMNFVLGCDVLNMDKPAFYILRPR